MSSVFLPFFFRDPQFLKLPPRALRRDRKKRGNTMGAVGKKSDLGNNLNEPSQHSFLRANQRRLLAQPGPVATSGPLGLQNILPSGALPFFFRLVQRMKLRTSWVPSCSTDRLCSLGFETGTLMPRDSSWLTTDITRPLGSVLEHAQCLKGVQLVQISQRMITLMACSLADD